MTNTITTATNLIFTQIKRGRASGKTYELTAGEFISIIKNKDSDGSLNVGVEPILDNEGEIESFTNDKFYDLPISEQLDMCCRREGDSLAAHISYEIAA